MNPNEELYFGLKLYEFVTLIAVLLGPVIAVTITLVFESRRRTRESRIQVMRMLLNTRHLASDPSYTIAINLVPVEFNRKKEVMKSWREYIETVRFKQTPQNQEEHYKLMVAKQTTLIYEIMKSLGFKLSETDIQTNAYASEGFINRDNLYLNSLRAMCDIAEHLKQQKNS